MLLLANVHIEIVIYQCARELTDYTDLCTIHNHTLGLKRHMLGSGRLTFSLFCTLISNIAFCRISVCTDYGCDYYLMVFEESLSKHSVSGDAASSALSLAAAVWLYPPDSVPYTT